MGEEELTMQEILGEEEDTPSPIELDDEELAMQEVFQTEEEEMNSVLADTQIKEHVTLVQGNHREPNDEDSNAFMNMLKSWNYTNNQLDKGFVRGVGGALVSAVDFTGEAIGELTGIEQAKDWMDTPSEWLENTFKTTSKAGDIAETVGRVSTGLFVTRGLGSGIVANTAQGALTELLFFDGDEANIADLFKDFGADNTLNEYLTTNDNDSELEQRMKNMLTGAGLGLAVDGIMSSIKYGKLLFKNTDMEFKGTDSELAQHVSDLISKDTKELADKVNPDVITKNTTQTVTKGQINEGDKIYEEAQAFIDGTKQVDATKQPLNPTHTATGNEDTFVKGTENVEATPTFKSHAQTIKETDEVLRKTIGKESFDLMDDMTKTASSLENLDVKVTQQRVIVGTLAKALDDSIKVAQKEPNTSNILLVMQNLKNLNTTATTLKNSQSSIARAMSSMRIKTANSDMMNTLKLLDAIDPENAMMRLKQSVDDPIELQKFIDDLNDTSKTLKDKVENMQDSIYTKVTNSLSEVVVAGMLSAPSTLAVNVIGNSLIKTQQLVQDTAQFVWGQTLRTQDRMGWDTYKHLLHSQSIGNWKELKHIGTNIKSWGASKFSDEVFDNNVLVKFKQDQDFSHKYFDSKYWRGAEAGQGGAFNNAINIYGKLARSPYNVIGFVDDYYKRGAFKAELIRLGGRKAVSMKLKGKDFDKYINNFIQANTEIRMLTNQGKVPLDDWLVKNKDYIGTGQGITKYSDIATDRANNMTFQKELGQGLVGKGVNLLNSDGLLRTLIPFKLTPINILKHAVSTASAPLRHTLNGDIIRGGLKGDIARAKITTSVAILYGLSEMATSGHVTGTFSKEERATMTSAGIPELSIRIGDKWFEYKQVEPYATIMGVMADLHKLKTNLAYRLEDAEIQGTVEQEFTTIMSDLAISLVSNITNKTYAKSLFEVLEVASGEKNLVDYSGNLLSGVSPLSSFTNYVGRVTNDDFKKEATTFTERLSSKYRWLLDRDALDLYGRPIKETEYTAGFTIKEYDANDPENAGAREVARLGINMGKMSKRVSFAGFNTELDEKQYWKMRRSLDKDFGLSKSLNKEVKSVRYLSGNEFKKKELLSKIIQAKRNQASKSILKDVEIQEGIKKDAKLLKVQVSRPKDSRTTYKDTILRSIDGK